MGKFYIVFKGLDSVNHMVQHMEKKCKKAKWLSEEALKIAEKKRSEKQRRKGKIFPFECRVPKNSKDR